MAEAPKARVSSLEVCPPDVLRCVTALLPGSDVMALFLCGAPKLSARLFNEGVSSLEFDWTSRRIRIWYPFVMKFRRLSRLSITASYERFFRRFEWSPNFSTLLELEFTMTTKAANASLWLDHVDPEQPGTPLNLSLAAPNLVTLKLRQCSVSYHFLALLPASLRTLQILVQSASASGENQPMEAVIAILPRDLEHLTIAPPLLPHATIVNALPQKLKTLRQIAYIEEATINLWPQSLELVIVNDTTGLSLESIAALPKCFQNVQTHLGSANLHIPDHVTTLKLMARANPISLPSNLTSLTLTESHYWRNNDFKELPKTLTFLEMRNMGPDLMPSLLKTLPKLRHLSFQRIESFNDDWLLEGLPDTLRELELLPSYAWSDAALAHLPRGLREVNLTRLKKISDAGIPLLPFTLTSIKLMSTLHITGNCFRDLPGGLHTFALEYAEKVENYHLSHLPRLLTYLRLGHAELISEDGFKLLPRRLKSLSLDEKSNISSTARVAELPHSLTLITMGTKIHKEFTEAYFKVRPIMLDTDEREEAETPILVPAKLAPASPSVFSSAFWKGLFGSKENIKAPSTSS